jgi:predicted enzyme related to lactoylglutathione lyase
MNSIVYFEIQSSNPERDKNFYGTSFNWKFTKMGFAPVEYYTIETNGCRGGLLKRPAPVPPLECGTNAFVNSIEVRDFDSAEKQILALGGKVALPKFAIPGKCWQGYFIDLDNNTFGIFEANPDAK